MIREGRSREWVKRLPKLISTKNSTPTRIIGKEPNLAIKLVNVNQGESHCKRLVGLKEQRLPAFVKVRYLYSPGEEEGGEKQRATDAVWSLKMYGLKRTVVSPDQPVLYWLATNAPKRGFVREELQVVPANSELPPNTLLATI